MWTIAGVALALAVIGWRRRRRRRDGRRQTTSPSPGQALDKAIEAALEHTGGGTVTETEVGDDGAAYGVEVRLDDGSQVEVNLDENFNVVSARRPTTTAPATTTALTTTNP